MSFSQNIKHFRLEKNLTQEQLAAVLGISGQAISKWETSETYPDGSMLVPLAQALGVSLDQLFGNEIYTMEDVSLRIIKLLLHTPAKDRLHRVRDLGWQMEKGLFNCISPRELTYSPKEILGKKASSYHLSDYGFTHISNGLTPFFAVFPEYGDNLTQAIGDGEEVRKLFTAMSSPEVMRSVLWIHRKEEEFVFEPALLGMDCGLEGAVLDNVLEQLHNLNLLHKLDVELNGEQRILYNTRPSHKVMALFIMAAELNYNRGYSYMSHHRNRPYLK